MADTNVTITVCDIDGRVIMEHKEHNLVVISGRNIIRDRLINTVGGLTHLAIGTDTTAVTSTQTSLGAQILIDTITQTVIDTAKLTVKYFLGTNDANGSTLTEAGIFNSSNYLDNVLLHFDGTAGSTITTDEYGSSWTNFGTAALSTAQFKFGTTALSLPGSTTSWVQSTVLTNVGPRSWTHEGWIYINSTAPNAAIIGSGTPYGLNLQVLGQRLYLFLGNTTFWNIADTIGGTSTITTGVWHHWAITYNSSSYKVWFNGIQDISVTSTKLINDSLEAIKLGISADGYSICNGYIDEYRFSKGTARYTATFTPSTAAFTSTGTIDHMYSRVVHAGIPKSSAITVTYNWELTWA